MNSTQLQTTTAALVAGAAGFAAGHGWLGLDTGTWGSIFTALSVIGVAIWPAVVTRLQSLKDTVGKSGAVVVTSRESADALPNNPNVIQAGPAAALQVNKAQ